MSSAEALLTPAALEATATMATTMAAMTTSSSMPTSSSSSASDAAVSSVNASASSSPPGSYTIVGDASMHAAGGVAAGSHPSGGTGGLPPHSSGSHAVGSSSSSAGTAATASGSGSGGTSSTSDIILSTLQRIATRSPLTVPQHVHGGAVPAGMLHRSSSPHSFLHAGGAVRAVPSAQTAAVPASMPLATPDLLAGDFASEEDQQGTWNPLPPQLPPHLRPPPASYAAPAPVQAKAQSQQPTQQGQPAIQPVMASANGSASYPPHHHHQHHHQAQGQTHAQHIQPQVLAGAPGAAPQQSSGYSVPQQQYHTQRYQPQPQQVQSTQQRVHYHHQYVPSTGQPHHHHHPQFNPHIGYQQGHVFKPRPSPIPFDDGQILLPSFVSSLSSARSSSPRSFTASTLLYPLPEDEEVMLQVLDEPSQPHPSDDPTGEAALQAMGNGVAMTGVNNGMAATLVGGSSFSTVSTTASSVADFGVVDTAAHQFVPSQHSAFRTPLSRPIAKKPGAVPLSSGAAQPAHHQHIRPHSPQQLQPAGANMSRGHVMQQPQITSISPLQLQQPIQGSPLPPAATSPSAASPLLVDREQQLRQVEGILQDALQAENATPCSKKDIEIFSHHVAMQRMAHENIKKRVLQQQQQQQPNQSSPVSASSPDSSGLATGQPPAKKAKRSRTDQAQYQQLEEVFLRDPLPSRKTKERLAQELGLTARKVQVWFQNRRAKERRQLREMGINDSEVLPNPWGE